MLEQPRNASIMRTGERPQPAPEQTVMHEQQVRFLLRGEAHRRLVQIHRGSHSGHRPGVGDLQTVESHVEVPHVPHPQVVVQVANEISELHHGRLGLI